MPKLSVAIPTHDMKDKQFFLARSLDALWNQTFQDFEIVVTDNSDDDSLKEVCDWYKTGIRYYKNPNKGMAQNTNEAMRRSKGELIKILYLDDFMAHNSALEEIVDSFEGYWLVTACEHTKNKGDRFTEHYPKYSEDIHTGNNTIGSPSVLTLLNKRLLFFDENMTWLLDCDLYKRYYDKYGPPTILNDINVVMGLGSHQATNTMGEERKMQEFNYILKKYA